MRRIADHDLRKLASTLSNMEDFVFLESSKVTDHDHLSLLFTNPLDWLVCKVDDSASDYLHEVERWRRKGKYLAGWIAYEFGYLLEPALNHFLQPHYRLSPGSGNNPLAVLGIFDEPVTFDHSTNLFLNGSSWPADPAGETAGFEISNMRTNIGHDDYLSAINCIKEYITAGHTYQVNYTMKLKFDFSGSTGDLYRTLRRNQSVSYAAWIRQGKQDIMSLSPELFYRADRDQITVRPMKGTLGRGRTTDEDGTNRNLLHNDEKNCSENIMIVDLLRNDLGRLLYETNGGRVKPRSLFNVETYETVLQMTSTIDGELDAVNQPDFADVIKAIFPCGSITGAPKIRTMEIIHELEKEERGVYCGAIGYSGPDRTIFNVPIRTLVIDGDKGEMGIGSGIIHDSDPEGEWKESLLKGNFLTKPIPEFQLIETMLWQPGSGYWLLDYHIRRLIDSARYFMFSCDEEQILIDLARAAETYSCCNRVRVLLHRDGRLDITSTEVAGMPSPELLQPQVADPLPMVAFCSQQTDPCSRYLFHKTTLREEYDAAQKLAGERGFFDLLFTNVKDEVTEGSITNIFIEDDGVLTTPPVACGLLQGAFRSYLIEHRDVRERVLSREDIYSADKVYVGNSVKGLVQVSVHPEEIPLHSTC